MFAWILLVAVGVYFAYPAVAPIFLASPYLNGFIILVFIFGVFACFWQVFMLITSVIWIEGFAIHRPGHELVQPPSLLLPLASLLRKRGALTQLTSTSSRSILDSVATRLDEGRDITRYIINLLIFLGLLGTFYGLAVTVPAVVDTIRSLAPQDGASTSSLDIFDNLMTGLEEQLSGMGTAFGSSLLGLAGSLIVGLLELFAGHGQNRFYRELEEWLSSITRLGVSSAEGGSESIEGGGIAGFLEYSTLQFDKLQDILAELRDRRTEQDQRMDSLSTAIEQLIDYSAKGQDATLSLLDRVAQGNEAVATAISTGDTMGGLDADSRERLKNIDTQMLRILEEINAGRSDALGELRGDIGELTSAIKALTKAAE
jgi:hypothetical protein